MQAAESDGEKVGKSCLAKHMAHQTKHETNNQD